MRPNDAADQVPVVRIGRGVSGHDMAPQEERKEETPPMPNATKPKPATKRKPTDEERRARQREYSRRHAAKKAAEAAASQRHAGPGSARRKLDALATQLGSVEFLVGGRRFAVVTSIDKVVITITPHDTP